MYIFAFYLYIYAYMTKKNRHNIIKELVQKHEIDCQETLLNMLQKKGFVLTQATLSRDIKELKIIKTPTANGTYLYQLSGMIQALQEEQTSLSSFGFVSIEFSGQLAVVKTRPGYAMGIASEIDSKASRYILGTVAGDDTILVIPRENISRKEIIESLSKFIPIS